MDVGVNEFELEVILRGPIYAKPHSYRQGETNLERDEIMRLRITLPRGEAMEVAAIALEAGEQHGRFAGEMVTFDDLDERTDS